MSSVWAVLLDTVSIQKYIFQSNKLKDNLGASFLIEKIYKEYLKDAVCEVFGKPFDINAWEKKPEEIKINKGDPFEVGYIGGGSAFLLFTEEPKAKEFIKTWTKLLLIYAPGVMTGVAMSKFDHEKENFSQEREKLFDELQKNKSQHIPETLLPRHGITAECSRSGLSMDIWNNTVDSYVSAGSNAVIKASKPAEDDINKKKYAKILEPDFCFTNELDRLGRISGEDSHIAIVHIDGNSMGERFKDAKTLVYIRELSKSVAKATKSAFVDLLGCIKKNYVPIMESLGFDDDSKDSKLKYPRNDNNCKILPILPVILGGDDITFICDGKLGLYFSKIFLKAFESQPVHDGKKLTACAGVAIIKTRYPFYRGYRLAEELCGNAKKASRKDNLNSYIDFHISMGGLAGNLEVIRKQYTDTPQGTLLFRPYKVSLENKNDEKSFDLLVKNTGILKKLPKNKIKELRDVMTWSEDERTIFVKKLEYRDWALPKIEGRSKFAESIFDS
ncbi:MAG: hypothetical protein JRG74_13000, partial [Deltaproteobacteria bacterium]|nr:hypothetical protein [Deltaproteobacteria bacterium]